MEKLTEGFSVQDNKIRKVKKAGWQWPCSDYFRMKIKYRKYSNFKTKILGIFLH